LIANRFFAHNYLYISVFSTPVFGRECRCLIIQWQTPNELLVISGPILFPNRRQPQHQLPPISGPPINTKKGTHFNIHWFSVTLSGKHFRGLLTKQLELPRHQTINARKVSNINQHWTAAHKTHRKVSIKKEIYWHILFAPFPSAEMYLKTI